MKRLLAASFGLSVFAFHLSGQAGPSAQGDSQHWYASPEWWLFIVAIPTLLLIWVQARQTKVAAQAAKVSAEAAKTSADALINSERAWVVPELIGLADKYGGQWHRIEAYGPVAMSTQEILAGYHLRYKLKFTNMGRGPAQILGFALVYTCLGEGVTDLPENGGGERVLTSYRAFERLLGGNEKTIEINEPIIDLGLYMRGDSDAIEKLEKTAVIHGWVKYRHMLSTTDDCYADFCYVYTVSAERLTPVGRYTKQRRQKVSVGMGAQADT